MANEPVRGDPHSHYAPGQPRMTHIEWFVRVRFDNRTLECTAYYYFDAEGETTLDTRGIVIDSVCVEQERVLEFNTFPNHPVIGDGIKFVVPASKKVMIQYKTSPQASGLQWLDPLQTAGRRFPFLFSQGQCLHTRSFLPCQDTPGVRFTFDATITVPYRLRALMGGKHVSRLDCATSRQPMSDERWVMDKPIPAYLVALAIGDLERRDITERSCVWAEPEMVAKAAAEFRDIGRMMSVAESLVGPYEWNRFDVLVLPPSFPYGGMENPCLTFVSPTIVAGDGSQASVVGHELAHAWTGNLVTNASWGDFWLNEGWTTWLEWRIVEALYGEEEAKLHIAVQDRDLYRDIARLTSGGHDDWTRLRVPMTSDVDPDDVFSRVPYSKGAHFIRALELAVGRGHFDQFVRLYIDHFSFTSITTQEFLDFVAEQLPGVLDQVGWQNWVDAPGMPDNVPLVNSRKANIALADAEFGHVPLDTRSWSPNQWVLYLQSLSRDLPPEFAQSLHQFGLMSVPHIEVRWSYLLFCLETGYLDDDIFHAVSTILTRVGRMKYILPLYRALAKSKDPRSSGLAQAVFAQARPTYHPIAVAQVERILKSATEKPAI